MMRPSCRTPRAISSGGENVMVTVVLGLAAMLHVAVICCLTLILSHQQFPFKQVRVSPRVAALPPPMARFLVSAHPW